MAYREFIINTRVNSPDTSPMTNKELVDDFDNIAFDNLLVASECLKQIHEKQTSMQNATPNVNDFDTQAIIFYLHESIYYLRVAVDITKDITMPDRRKACLNIRGNTRGVDVFRLINAQKMMAILINQIKTIYNNTPVVRGNNGEKWPALLLAKITDLEQDIVDIASICTQADSDIDRVY